MTAPEPVGLEPLHPRVVVAWRIRGLARGLGLAAMVGAAEWALASPLPVGVGATTVAVLAVAHAIVVPRLRYRAWGWTVRPTDVYLRHGILFRTTSIIPHARIQHVDTQHGPVDRWLGLADLVVFTAGSRGAVIPVPGLARDRAEAARDHLAAVSGAGDAV